MATTIISTDVIGNNVTYVLSDSSDIIVLTAGTRLIGTGYSYLFGTTPSIDVTIDGYAWLEANVGSPFYFAGGDTITIGPDAQMVLTSNAFFAAVTLGVGGSGTQFSNHGHITTRGGDGFFAGGGFNILRNYGTIDLTIGSLRYGSGSNDILLNAGLLTGQTSASVGIVAIEGVDNALTNTGQILTTRPGGYGVIDNSSSGTTTIVNTGDIISGLGTGIGGNGASMVINNSGTISGPNASLSLGGGSSVVTNTGHLNGNVIFGAGADVFRGIGGIVTGTVSGGGGSDAYYTSDSALTIVEVAAGGTDTVYSAVSFRLAAQIETLRLQGFAVTGIGNTSNNTMIGNGADNRLFGLGGADNLLGAEGNDTIGGGDGNDTLQGQDGDDWLRGAAGNDSLTAGVDNDTLIGAIGVDTMSGGTGEDQFVFVRQTDSGITAATSDLILDFARGQDVIDVSALDASLLAPGNQQFTFIGTTGFAGIAGQLRFSSAAGVTTVQMDTNGNGTADMTIRLTGTLALTAHDFVL